MKHSAPKLNAEQRRTRKPEFHGVVKRLMRVKLGQQYWRFAFGRTAPGTWGLCDPSARPKRITVSSKLSEFNTFDTRIHEFLHAADTGDMIAEEWIERTGTELAHALWRLGYRRTGG